MNEFQLHGLIRGVLVPGALTGIIFLLSRLLPLSLRETVRSGGALAAFACSYVLLVGLPHWPLTGSPNGIWTAIVLVALWTTLEQFVDRRVWFKRYLGIAVISVAILRPLISSAWSMPETATEITLIGAIATVLWFVVERAFERMHSSAVTGGAVVLGVGAAGIMFIEGSALMAQMTGVWCAILGTVTVLGLWSALKASRELLTFMVMMAVALVVAHIYFVEASIANWLWIAISFSWFVIRGFIKRPLSAPKDLALTVLVMALPIAIKGARFFLG